MFLFCWYFDFLCKFKIFNEPWYIDKRSFLLYFAYFFSSKVKDWSLKLAYASQFMQNMAVDSLIENIKAKIIIKFHFTNFMIYLARVTNSMVIFSASYVFKVFFCMARANEHNAYIYSLRLSAPNYCGIVWFRWPAFWWWHWSWSPLLSLVSSSSFASCLLSSMLVSFELISCLAASVSLLTGQRKNGRINWRVPYSMTWTILHYDQKLEY